MDIPDIANIVLRTFSVEQIQRYYSTHRKLAPNRRKKEEEYRLFSCSTPEHNFAAAITSKDPKWIVYFRDRVTDKRIGALIAATAGNMDLILYFDGEFYDEAARVAAEHGHMDVVRYMVEFEKENVKGPPSRLQFPPIRRYNVISGVLFGGVIGDRMDMIEYALSKGAHADYGLHEAVVCGNMKMVRYFAENGAQDIHAALGHIIHTATLNPFPGMKINSEMVEYLLSIAGEDEDSIYFVAITYVAAAASINRMDLVTKYMDDDRIWKSVVLDGAILSGNIETVKLVMGKTTEICADIDLAICLGHYAIADYITFIGVHQTKSIRRLYDIYEVGDRILKYCSRLRFVSEDRLLPDTFMRV